MNLCRFVLGMFTAGYETSVSKIQKKTKFAVHLSYKDMKDA